MTNLPKRTATAQRDYIKTAVRFPPALHADLRAEAERKGRSLNALVIAKLQEDSLTEVRSELDEMKAMLRKILEAVT